MRVGIDAYPLTVQCGGIKRYTENLVRGLGGLTNCDTFTLFRSPDASAESLGLGANFRIDRARHPFRGLLDHLHVRNANSTVDLYHGTNYFVPLLGRVPSILTVHDLSVRLFPDRHPGKRRLQHRILPSLCRRARRIIAVSESTRNDLVQLVDIPPEKIDVIRHAVGPEFSRIANPSTLAAVRGRYALPGRFVLYVGVIEPRKDLDRLLDAVALLAQRGLRIPLVLAGFSAPRYGALLRRRADAAGLEIGRDVVFTGFVEERDLPALYSLCSVFVYPSVYEGFGLPPLEAMACGAPTVVADTSSLAELYGDCSVRAAVASPDSLSDAIAGVLESGTLRERLVELGAKRAGERTWESVARETLAVYRRVAAEL